MIRRSFLKSVAAIAAAIVMPKPKPKQVLVTVPNWGPTPGDTELEKYRFGFTGFKHANTWDGNEQYKGLSR